MLLCHYYFHADAATMLPLSPLPPAISVAIAAIDTLITYSLIIATLRFHMLLPCYFSSSAIISSSMRNEWHTLSAAMPDAIFMPPLTLPLITPMRCDFLRHTLHTPALPPFQLRADFTRYAFAIVTDMLLHYCLRYTHIFCRLRRFFAIAAAFALIRFSFHYRFYFRAIATLLPYRYATLFDSLISYSPYLPHYFHDADCYAAIAATLLCRLSYFFDARQPRYADYCLR